MSSKFPAYTSLLNVFAPEELDYVGVDSSDDSMLLNILSDDTGAVEEVDVTVKSEMLFETDTPIEEAPDEHLVLALATEGHAIDTTANALNKDCESVEELATEVWSETVANIDYLQGQIEAVTKDEDVNKTDVFINEILKQF